MTTDPALLARLKEMEKDWARAPVGQGGELDGIDDGEGYQGRVEAFEMFPGKKDPSALYLKTNCSIQNHSEHGGRPITRLDNVMDPTKLGYLKEFLHKLGVDVDTPLSDLIDPTGPTLNNLLDTWFVFDVYTNARGYRNWAVRQRLDDGDLGTSQEQIEGFEKNESLTEVRKSKTAAKPDNCICEDPSEGKFNEDCPIAGHGSFDF